MDRWKGCVALVTGASSGIGAEICRLLVKYGITVVGIARNVGKIRAIAREEAVDNAPGHLFGIKCDLANEEEILSVFEKIRDDFGRIDICINNAGFDSNSSLISGHSEDWRSIIDVNVMALCICTRESLKLMREKNINTGQIIHISSMAGHRVPSASCGFYSGTKFMVRALAEGLRKELRLIKSHIRVACISPGLVETGFAYRQMEDPERASELYKSLECLQPADVAESVLYILSTNPRVDVNDILIRPVEQEL